MRRKGRRDNSMMRKEGIDGSFSFAPWYISGSERIAHTLKLGVGTVCPFFFFVYDMISSGQWSLASL